MITTVFALETATNASFVTYIDDPIPIPSSINAVIDCSLIINAALESYETVCITWYIDGIPVLYNTSLSEISLDKKFLFVFANDECHFINGHRILTENRISCEATQCLNVEGGVADFSKL